MANAKLYSIKDNKSGGWDNPYVARTHGEAERIFSGAINRGESLLAQHPEDFSLWCIGTYDPTTGILERTELQHIGEAVQFQNAKQQAVN